MEEKVVETVVAKTAAPVEANAQQPRENNNSDRRPQRRNGPHRKGPGRPREQVKEFEERVVSINRISKTVKGGRKMRFAALVVVGDKKGRFGFGTGKSGEVPDAIKKALDVARKNITRVHIVKGGTITHEVMGEFGASKVFLKPAPEGTGIIAGGAVRAILELAGLRNVYSKVYGSKTSLNVIRASYDGISKIKSYAKVKALRSVSEE